MLCELLEPARHHQGFQRKKTKAKNNSEESIDPELSLVKPRRVRRVEKSRLSKLHRGLVAHLAILTNERFQNHHAIAHEKDKAQYVWLE